MSARRAFLAVLCAALCSLLLVQSATAGELRGRVIERRPVEASVGGLGGFGTGGFGTSRASESTPIGPILIYVGEASEPLPQRETAGARLRLAGGAMTPTLQAVTVGSVVDFENAEADACRIVGRSSHGTFDLGWQAGGTLESHEMESVGVFTVRDALADRTLGELIVLSHSAFVIADGGKFSLPDLPAGEVTIVAYSPQHGEISRSVKVPESGVASVDLVF